MMTFEKRLLVINSLLLAGFCFAFIQRGNTEFLIYIGVTVFFLALIAFTLRKIDYSRSALVGLTIWSAMHLAGVGGYMNTSLDLVADFVGAVLALCYIALVQPLHAGRP